MTSMSPRWDLLGLSAPPSVTNVLHVVFQWLSASEEYKMNNVFRYVKISNPLLRSRETVKRERERFSSHDQVGVPRKSHHLEPFRVFNLSSLTSKYFYCNRKIIRYKVDDRITPQYAEQA